MKKITNKITYGITNEQQTNNKQITTNKNDKNIKNEKEVVEEEKLLVYNEQTQKYKWLNQSLTFIKPELNKSLRSIVENSIEENSIEKNSSSKEDVKLYDENVSKINDLMIECLNTTNINNIKECINYLDKIPIELIEYGLKKTSRIDRPSWKYAMSILDSYVQNGFTNLKEIEADELKFKNKNKSEKKEETFEEQVERYKREWGIEDED